MTVFLSVAGIVVLVTALHVGIFLLNRREQAKYDRNHAFFVWQQAAQDFAGHPEVAQVFIEMCGMGGE